MCVYHVQVRKERAAIEAEEARLRAEEEEARQARERNLARIASIARERAERSKDGQ